MEAIIKGRGIRDIADSNPFIWMFYVEDGEHKIYRCNWTLDFVNDFKDKTNSGIEVAYFFVMGSRVVIHSIDEAIKFCNA